MADKIQKFQMLLAQRLSEGHVKFGSPTKLNATSIIFFISFQSFMHAVSSLGFYCCSKTKKVTKSPEPESRTKINPSLKFHTPIPKSKLSKKIWLHITFSNTHIFH